MSKFLNQALIRRKTHLITESEYRRYVKAYESKDEETKKIYNENAELYFSGRQNLNKDISAIRNNVTFFFWLTIVSLVCGIINLITIFG